MEREDNILSDCEHLYAEDFNGKEVTLTVKAVEKAKVHKDDKSPDARKKWEFSFVETPKTYLPGVGVRRAITAAVGSTDRHKIVGKRLVFYPTTCDAFGKRDTPCIRFRGLAADKKGGEA
jgi:hypothetical protein